MSTRKHIFEVWRNADKTEKFCAMSMFLKNVLGCHDLNEEEKQAVHRLNHEFKKRWIASQYTVHRFLQNNATWLEDHVFLPNVNVEPPPPNENRPRGRPSKRLEECHPKVQRSKVSGLADLNTEKELSLALSAKLHMAGKRNASMLVMEVSSASNPSVATTSTPKTNRKRQHEDVRTLSCRSAIAMMIDANLSAHQYQIIRKSAKQCHSNLFPPIYLVKREKKNCYPLSINVSETSAEVDLKSLIEHTTQRLFMTLGEVLNSIGSVTDGAFQFIIKWGCDGSAQNVYKQKFDNSSSTDENLFTISMVPIRLNFTTHGGDEKIIWQNMTPSSTRFCRPIKLLFAKETDDLINSEVEAIKTQIKNLSVINVVVNGEQVRVKPVLILCMIDGKVINALTECQSTQSCYICKAKPSDMNDRKKLSTLKVSKDYLDFGISPLHARIRFLEFILKLSYRLEIRNKTVRGEENKKAVAKKKKYIQDRFREELGLLVDVPKQHFGNTNDGNTSRRFFANAEKAADITGVDVRLIKRCGVILDCINSSLAINSDKFGIYTSETFDFFLDNYGWYTLPGTVHKVLCHGREIISSSIIPVGQMSEEAQETRNKEIRKYRESFTRKISRNATNRDLLNRLLISSDPVISSCRVSPKKKLNPIRSEVRGLLAEPSFPENLDEISSSESDTDIDI